jgi:hypothetical protein
VDGGVTVANVLTWEMPVGLDGFAGAGRPVRPM